MPIAPLRIKGCTAVITGASSGIGRALALKAAAEGMALAICDMDAKGLSETVDLAAAHGVSAMSAVIDVRDAAALSDFASAVEGPITLVFANAGVMLIGPLKSLPAEHLQIMFDVNVIGVANTLQAFLPKLQAQEIRSKVVITGSQASFVSFPNLAGYSATKHALFAMAEALAAELAAEDSPVGVSFIAPGAVATGIFGANSSPNADKSLAPNKVADIVFEALVQDRYLISTHADLSGKIGAHLACLQEKLS
jgi:short-subunit dehydrogenase